MIRILSVSIAAVAAIFVGCHFLSKAWCYEGGKLWGIESHHSFALGCQLRTTDGQWLPASYVVPVLKDGKTIFVPKPQVRPEAVKVEQ